MLHMGRPKQRLTNQARDSEGVKRSLKSMGLHQNMSKNEKLRYFYIDQRSVLRWATMREVPTIGWPGNSWGVACKWLLVE